MARLDLRGRTLPLVQAWPHLWIIQIGIPGLMLAIVLGLLVAQVVRGPAPLDPPVAAALLMVAMMAAVLVRSLRIPHRMRISLEGQVEFEGPLLRVQFRPDQVLSIAPSQEPGMFVLRHQGGQIRFFNQFTGFHEFLTWLVQENPRVDLKGC